MPRDFDRDKRFRGDDKKSVDSKEDFLDKYEAELARKKKEAEEEAARLGTSLEGMAALAKYKTTRLSKVLELQFGPPLETQLVGSATPISVAQVDAYFSQNDDVRPGDVIGQMRLEFREQQRARARAAEAAGLVKPGTVVPGPFVAASGRAPVIPDERSMPHFDEVQALIDAPLGIVKASPRGRRVTIPSAASTPTPTQPALGQLTFQPITRQNGALRAPATAPVQMKAADVDSAMSAADVREAAALGASGSGHALPFADQLQKAFGNRDLSGIKAYTDSSAAAGAAAMGARAYATGNHVVFGDNPDLHTVAHEVAHVLQQQAGVHLSSELLVMIMSATLMRLQTAWWLANRRKICCLAAGACRLTLTAMQCK
jgi:hypothetical protein